MRRRIGWVWLVLVLVLGAEAARAEVVAIQAGRLLDGSGAAAVRDAVLLIEDGIIRSVGPDVTIPADARIIDLSGRTVLPGFIDAHVHLTGRTIGEGENWQDAAVRDLPQEDAIRGVRNAWLTLQAGFTTVRNVGAGEFSDVALRNMIDAAVVPGPRMLVAGHSLGITGGHCDTNGYVPGLFEPSIRRGVVNGADGIRAAIREQVKYGADVIKTCATGGVLSEGDAVGVQQYTLEELRALVEEAHLRERKVAAHAHGNEGIKAALRAGVDSIEHGSVLDDEAIELFLQRGAYLVPTMMAFEAVERQASDGTLAGLRKEKALFIGPRARESFRRAAAAGVNIALGSDAGVFAHGTQGREFTLMVEYGLEPMQAIMAGTSAAAELLGLSDNVGRLAPGMVADVVAVAGDPLQDISVLEHVDFVMHSGRVLRAAGNPIADGGFAAQAESLVRLPGL